MKKKLNNIIILIIWIIGLQSCVTTKLIGNITTYTHDGKEIKTWKDVTIQEETFDNNTKSALKSWGLNFYDKETDKFIIISNAVPYTIEYKAKHSSTSSKNEERKYPEWGTR